MKKILLIDDNSVIRVATAEILRLADYEVLTASNGKEGVELAKKKLPDLILCDIVMPILDGYGVLKILSKNVETAKIPFIFITSKASKVDLRKGMNLGADDYLIKPFNENDLLETVDIRIKRANTLKRPSQLRLDFDDQDQNKGLDELMKLSKSHKEKWVLKKEKSLPRE